VRRILLGFAIAALLTACASAPAARREARCPVRPPNVGDGTITLIDTHSLGAGSAR